MGKPPFGRIPSEGRRMTVGSILTGKKPVVSVATAMTIREVAALLHDNRIGAVLVCESGTIRGIVSERDIVAGLHRHGAGVLDATAATIMSAPVVSAAPSTTVVAAMGVMTNRRIRHLPVIEDGTLLGLVSIGDLVKQRIEDAEAEANALKDYIASA